MNRKTGGRLRELWQLFASFAQIGALTFGGGYAMLPMLERELVTKHNWVTMEELVNYFAVGQCTPGIIAVNTATFVGYKRQKILGGITATFGVIFPSLVIIMILAGVLQLIMGFPVVQHAFNGISVAVSALLVQSIWKMICSGVKGIYAAVVAAAAMVLALVLPVTPAVIVVLGGLSGVIYGRIKAGRAGKGEQA